MREQVASKLVETNVCGQRLMLHPHKAVYWKDKSTLLVADMHLGKSMHFRKAGIAIPKAVSRDNWQRFIDLLEFFNPQTVLFLGDLFHSYHNSEWNSFDFILKNFPGIQYRLIIGNHDILEESVYERTGIETVEYHLICEKFILTHVPLKEVPEGYYNLAGHVHPAVRMRGTAGQGMKLPCFLFRKDRAILPAFGAFTGFSVLRPERDDRIFIIVNDLIMEAR